MLTGKPAIGFVHCRASSATAQSICLDIEFFEKAPVLTRKELDTELRHQYGSDYRAMPSAASAQRQGQVIAKQFKGFAKAAVEYSKHPEKFQGKPRLPGYKRNYRTFYVGRNGYQIRDYRLTITGGKDIGFSAIRIVCCKHQEFNAKAEDAVTGDSENYSDGKYIHCRADLSCR